ncbi:MAG TPA: hypothetical protein VFU72_11920 [Nitrolancea sp.]|jgi:hypothetical protein|nr:hypothetical protein [Nitrolancea sp.]
MQRAVTRPALAPPAVPPPVERAVTFALLVSAFRCTVQYVLLPFVVPWVGVATLPPWFTLALTLLAGGMLGRNARALWRLRHAQRWTYLLFGVALVGALLLFIAVDLRALLT